MFDFVSDLLTPPEGHGFSTLSRAALATFIEEPRNVTAGALGHHSHAQLQGSWSDASPDASLRRRLTAMHRTLKRAWRGWPTRIRHTKTLLPYDAARRPSEVARFRGILESQWREKGHRPTPPKGGG